MVKNKIMFMFIKKVFIGSLISIVNASNHTKCKSLSNQKCTTQPTLFNLQPSEYNTLKDYVTIHLRLI